MRQKSRYEERDLDPSKSPRASDNSKVLGLQGSRAGRGAESSKHWMGTLNQKRTNINKGLAFDAVYLLSLSLYPIHTQDSTPPPTHSHFLVCDL